MICVESLAAQRLAPSSCQVQEEVVIMSKWARVQILQAVVPPGWGMASLIKQLSPTLAKIIGGQYHHL